MKPDHPKGAGQFHDGAHDPRQDVFRAHALIAILPPSYGKALTAGGIATHGLQGLFYEPDLGRIHGLNERIGTSSLY